MTHPYAQLQETLSLAEIRHVEVSFPIEYVGDDQFTFATCSDPDFQFSFSLHGLDYVAYRTKGDSKRYRELLASEQFEWLADTINEGSPEGKLIAATFNGQLVGLLTTYLPVAHDEIAQKLADVGLRSHVVSWSLDMLALHVRVLVETDAKWLVSLKITNGHSGHVAFGYAASFRTGQFEFDFPLVDRVRHMAKVGSSLENLKTVLDAANDALIAQKLRDCPLSTATKLISDAVDVDGTKRQREIMDQYVHGTLESTMEFAIWLGEWTEKRGYKVAATQLLNMLMKMVFPEA